jgi:hypothetical protein
LEIKVLFFTNARLITTELTDLFTRILSLEIIEITVYGIRSESCDTVACAPGAYAEFRRCIERLLKRNISFIVKER